MGIRRILLQVLTLEIGKYGPKNPFLALVFMTCYWKTWKNCKQKNRKNIFDYPVQGATGVPDLVFPGTNLGSPYTVGKLSASQETLLLWPKVVSCTQTKLSSFDRLSFMKVFWLKITVHLDFFGIFENPSSQRYKIKCPKFRFFFYFPYLHYLGHLSLEFEHTFITTKWPIPGRCKGATLDSVLNFFFSKHVDFIAWEGPLDNLIKVFFWMHVFFFTTLGDMAPLHPLHGRCTLSPL